MARWSHGVCTAVRYVLSCVCSCSAVDARASAHASPQLRALLSKRVSFRSLPVGGAWGRGSWQMCSFKVLVAFHTKFYKLMAWAQGRILITRLDWGSPFQICSERPRREISIVCGRQTGPGRRRRQWLVLGSAPQLMRKFPLHPSLSHCYGRGTTNRSPNRNKRATSNAEQKRRHPDGCEVELRLQQGRNLILRGLILRTCALCVVCRTLARSRPFNSIPKCLKHICLASRF